MRLSLRQAIMIISLSWLVLLLETAYCFRTIMWPSQQCRLQVGGICTRAHTGTEITSPSVVAHSQLLLDSYERALKTSLLPREGDAVQQAVTLFDLPGRVVVSHGTEEDPILNYGNKIALTLWEMDFATLTSTPSRKTAEAMVREKRQAVLEQVKKQGACDTSQYSMSGKTKASSSTALPLLEATRALSHPRALFSSQTLEAAELLVAEAQKQGDDTAVPGVGGIVAVIRWVMNVLGSATGKKGREVLPQQEQEGMSSQSDHAGALLLGNPRLWKVCSQCLQTLSTSDKIGPSGALFPISSTLGLCQAIAVAMFPSTAVSIPELDGETGLSLCTVFSLLSGIRLPSCLTQDDSGNSSSTGGALAGGIGAPLSVVPVDRFLDFVEGLVTGLARTGPTFASGTAAALVTMALQHLARLQAGQANQRKGFTTVVERLLEPLLALSSDPDFKGMRDLRRAVDQVISDVVLHKEQMEGLRTLMGAGGKGHSQGKKRKRKEAAVTGPSGEEGEEEEGTTTAGAPTPKGEEGGGGGGAAGSSRWAGYQVLLLDKLDEWVNGEAANREGRRRVSVIRSLLGLYQAFLRRAAALAAADVEQQAAGPRASSQQQQQQQQQQQHASSASTRTPSQQQQAGVVSNSLWAKPMFLMGVKLWAMLWKGVGSKKGGHDDDDDDEEEESARARTARAMLEALAEREVYKYDSDTRGAEEFKALTGVLSQLMEGAKEPERSSAVLKELQAAMVVASHDEDDDEGEGGEEDEAMNRAEDRARRRRMVDALEAEVACVGLLLRVDHRVVGARVKEVVALLAVRFHVLGRAGGPDAKAVLGCRHRCVAVIGELVDTYGKLRQVQGLLEAILGASSGQGEEEDAVEALLRRKDCQGTLARVMRDCPSPQLGPLFDALRGALSNTSATGASRVVVRLLVILLANMTVSAYNASELRDKAVATLRELSGASSSVAMSLDPKRFRAQRPLLAGLALELAGWLLHTLVICQYWSAGDASRGGGAQGGDDGKDDVVAVKELLALGEERMDAGGGGGGGGRKGGAERRAMDRLVVARMRQLNQEMAESGANLAGAVGQAVDLQREEMKALVGSLLAGEAYDLQLMGSCLGLWVRHCEEHHVQAFWRAVLHEASMPSLGGDVKAILGDAELYEMPRLPEALYGVWAGLVGAGLLGDVADEVVSLDVPAVGALVERVIGGGVDEQHKHSGDKKKKKKKKDEDKLATRVRNAVVTSTSGDVMTDPQRRRLLQLVKILNSLPQGYLPQESQCRRFLLSMLLEHLLSSSSEPHQEDHQETGASSLKDCLRQALEVSALQALLADLPTISSEILDRRPALLRWLVGGENRSRLDMVGTYQAHLVRAGREVAVGRLIAAAEERLSSRAGAQAPLVFELAKPFLEAQRLEAVVGREALMGMMKRNRARLAEEMAGMASEALQLAAALVELEAADGEDEDAMEEEEGSLIMDEALVRTIVDAASGDGDGPLGSGMRDFLAAVVRWKGPSSSKDEEDDGDAAAGDEKGEGEGDEGEEEGDEEEEGGIAAVALDAMLARETAVGVDERLSLVMQAVLGSGSSLVKRAVTTLVSKLKWNVGRSSSFARSYEGGCHLLAQLIELSDGQAEAATNGAKAVLGRVGKEVISALVTSMPRMMTEGEASAVLAALDLLQVCVKKRWLVKLAAGEVVAVLGTLSSVPMLFATPVAQGTRQCLEQVYVGICGTLSLLLKHYARVLYLATPALFVTLRSLYRQLLASGGGLTRGEEPGVGSSKKAKRRKAEQQRHQSLGLVAAKGWARLGEHLAAPAHQAAFRKPLVRVLADYVATAATLDLPVREAILPAVYATLNVMTSFEIDHLNAALLDAAGQSVFRKLHTDFQTQHRYKGKV